MAGLPSPQGLGTVKPVNLALTHVFTKAQQDFKAVARYQENGE